VVSAEHQVEQLRHRVAEQVAELARRDAELERRDAELAQREQEIVQLRQEVARLKAVVEELTQAQRQHSGNSNKPPSSDPPGSKPKEKGRGKRRRGGQKGHKGHQRVRLPESEVDVVDFYPGQCENCWKPLPQVPDLNASWHQVTEIPPVTPKTTEYRWHEVACPCCQYKTRASRDRDIPDSRFGPRLSSIIAMLTGAYHLSRRRAKQLLADLVGVEISLGGISNVEARVSAAVAPAVEEAWAHAADAKAKHTDGTSWKMGDVPLSLWTIATAAVTVFKIVIDSKKETLRGLFGKLKGILISDRAKALNFWAMNRRQICWAHLVRKFVSFSERDGPAGSMGRTLLEYTGVLFAYWHDYRDKRIPRKVFLHRMAPVRQQIEALLERVVAADIRGVSGACADILAHRAALWTFVDQRGVEPTNNHAERELRAFVLWRKRCFGTQSERGNVFAERMMTVVHTARKQQRDVLPLLTDYCRAAWIGRPTPTLINAD